ncbi:MAG: PD-(D/E)XK nuclease family protein [Thermoplasmata archaeon]|nr:PD-(D/E)XK nuclease family protein [Thermoplasmata archaeon]MCI4359603.1 PD-(D/E)XK nuclease family protein [Thermoplasmata archaeon]
MAENPTDSSPPWLSVSDLAEYAYCPRAYWYRHHPPREPPDPGSVRSSQVGEAYHRHALRGIRHREDRGAAVGLLAVAGAAVLALLLLLGGFL